MGRSEAQLETGTSTQSRAGAARDRAAGGRKQLAELELCESLVAAAALHAAARPPRAAEAREAYERAAARGVGHRREQRGDDQIDNAGDPPPMVGRRCARSSGCLPHHDAARRDEADAVSTICAASRASTSRRR